MAPATSEGTGADAAACRCVRRRFKRTAQHARVATAFKALGDETRLAMVQMIVEAGELCACEIEQQFDLSQPTISHHLKLLRNAGLIRGKRHGTWIHYRAEVDLLTALAAHPVLAQR